MLVRLICASLCLGAFVVNSPAASERARLEVKLDEARSSFLFRAGPVKLPAGAGTQRLGSIERLEYAMPFSGAAVAFRLRVADPAGAELPGSLLQMASLERPPAKDVLCAEYPQRLFLAYSAPWLVPEFPGTGFALEKSDKLRFAGELHNPTGRDYAEAYIELRVYFRERAKSSWPVTSVTPFWIEASECGKPGYDLPVGRDVKRREFQAPRSGKILALAATGSEFTARLLVERLPGEVLADISRQPDGTFPLVNWMPRGCWARSASKSCLWAAGS